MAAFGIYEIVQCTRGKLQQGKLQGHVRGVSTNSKTVKKGELFIAIVGKKHDAHGFIAEVIKRGVSAIVVSQDVKCPESVAVIKVKDTTKALGDIALLHRLRFSIPVVAITGSAGKTTTKEMISRVLSAKYNVLKNIGTENNQFGVPLTILKLKPSHDVAVLEVGTNSPGNIKSLAAIARPTVVVMTNIGESHLELLKTPADVFKEKFDLVLANAKDGAVIVNQDDYFLRNVKKLTRQKVFTYGITEKADFQAKNIIFENAKVKFVLNKMGTIALRGTATANVSNALAAICCGRLFKISYNDIKLKLKTFSLKSGRQTFVKTGGIALIDDSYNANPVSFRNALQGIAQFKTTGRRILICGDMLELGDQSERLHAEIGECAAKSGLDLIVSLGNFSRMIGVAASRRNALIAVTHAASLIEAEGRLKGFLRKGDVVLVKGSRGMAMERFVEFIKENYKN